MDSVETLKEARSQDLKNIKKCPDLKNFPCRRPSHANPRLFEFQRYLDLAGVTKALSQALGRLCAQKPKPTNPMHFIVDQMTENGLVAKWSEGVISLRNELSQLRTLVMYAQTENERLDSFLKRSGLFEEEEEAEDETYEAEEEFEAEEKEKEVVPTEEAVQVQKTKPVTKVGKNNKSSRKTKSKNRVNPK